MSSLNRASLLGFVASPLEWRDRSGVKSCRFKLTTAELDRPTDQSIRRKHKVQWHRVVVLSSFYTALIESAGLEEGARLYVEGSIEYRSSTDAGGVRRQLTEIVVGAAGGKLLLLDRRPSWAEAQEGEQDDH